MNMVKEEVGHRIREFRHKRKLSLRKVAQAADIGENHLGMIELAKREPRITTFLKILAAMKVSLQQFEKGI